MARIVLDQYRKLIDCRLVQIMDRDRDTDFLDQLVFLVLQRLTVPILKSSLLGSQRLGSTRAVIKRYILFYHTCCIRYNPVQRDLATTREILDLQDTVRLSVLGHSFPETGDDTT